MIRSSSGDRQASVRKIVIGMVAACAALLAMLATGTASASETAGTFAGQVKGLTATQAAELQRRVDSVIATTGGKQIAANKVLWKGGNGATTVVLPGETRARNLGPKSIQAAAFPYGCPYRALCLYGNGDFTGPRHDLWSCVDHHTPYYFESYSNNQTRGTVGIFKNDARREIGRTGPAPSAGRWDFGTTTWYVKPC